MIVGYLSRAPSFRALAVLMVLMLVSCNRSKKTTFANRTTRLGPASGVIAPPESLPPLHVGGVVSLAIHDYGDAVVWADRKSTRLNSSHSDRSRMPSSA